MRGEDGAPRRLGRMRRQDELERDALLDLPLAHAVEQLERLGERLARDELLVRVLAPPAHAVVLLRDVRELEVEGERAQHARLPRHRKRLDRVVELVPARAAARGPRERADVLDVLEQPAALLLDEHPPEQVAEQPDVPPQRRVGSTLVPHSHGSSLETGRSGRRCAGGRQRVAERDDLADDDERGRRQVPRRGGDRAERRDDGLLARRRSGGDDGRRRRGRQPVLDEPLREPLEPARVP